MNHHATNLGTLRLGVVPYHNVLPLLHGLDNQIPRANWVFAPPSRLAELLSIDQLDIAILPIFDWLRSGRYGHVPGCAIGADGPVRSVIMAYRGRLTAVRRVLLDRSSLTSIHLARVLAADHWGLARDVEWTTSAGPVQDDTDWAAEGFDACVAIGDVALRWCERGVLHKDLANDWKELTGLPFVFAVWATRQGVLLTTGVCQAFQQSLDAGLDARAQLAAEHHAAAGVPQDVLLDYLTNRIRYELGPPQARAVAEFGSRLVRLGLLPAHTPLPRITTREANAAAT